MTIATEERLLTGNEVAVILGRDRQTIRIYARTGRIRSTKVGPHYRYKRAWVDEFLKAGETAMPEAAGPKPTRNPKYAGR